MKFAAKVVLWVAVACIVVAIVLLSLSIGNLGWGFIVAGTALVLAALICVTIGVVLFLKDDDRHNLAESADDAPKAH